MRVSDEVKDIIKDIEDLIIEASLEKINGVCEECLDVCITKLAVLKKLLEV